MNLAAWEPPDPPDVADAVIARMHAATPAEHEPPPRRRLWWLLALPAAAAIIALVATRGGDDAPADGAITADRARHVDLGGASVDLEPNTTIRWHRDRDGLRVEQLGTATWTTTDHLRITAGATSIDATAANLRVESKMNRQDAATVTTAAITAAAVALVTITVYNGVVRAGAGPIAPGTTIAISPIDRTAARPTPPPPPPPCDADDLKQRGEEALANGDYAGAGQIMADAYACKPEAQTALRAYLAACKRGDGATARDWFDRLPESQRENTSVLQICLNSGVDPRSLEFAADATVKISSTPTGAAILVDGRDLHVRTPAKVALPAGKHEITLVAGDHRQTWSLAVTAGQTLDFAKKLP